MSVASLCGKQVDVVISGNTSFQGVLIEVGRDILVLFDGQRFIYIPLLHVHRINLSPLVKEGLSSPSEISLAKGIESISYRTILNNAKGLFVEVYVTGNISLHGYVISVRNDYFIFYSPVYKTILISFHHLKWLIPYNFKTPPYTLSNEKFPVIPSQLSFLRSFEEQLKKWEGELVVFDMGADPMKIGLVKKVSDTVIELVTANGQTVFLKISHIKAAHLP
ncbi:DUF2642 domain-containing protein [Ectobacillus sp. JY-23]|uniref:DUF2642 domain-containing protein n=1 Tax=Ectobacillus sp. JY-23 TaxID=2933872 RepID=UPI001FF26B77|nr:DUF2642 domain-containing protein [Ectobacillus sp. JY-23]UOY93026.1 DUF2642 domain-containing protein [Ectobacillus sp. JY-23]